MSKICLEHIWMRPEKLPATLGHMFSAGACVVFQNEQLMAAIPATNDQTHELADLAEVFAIGEVNQNDPAWLAYYNLRSKLCSPLGLELLTKVFRQEMGKLQEASEAYEAASNERYLKLASACRPKHVENN